MTTKWNKVLVEDVAEKIAMGPFGSDIKTDNFVSQGVPIIRGSNLTAGRFNGDNFVYLTEDKANQLSSANAFPDDLVFTHRGTLGQVGIIPKNPYRRYVISQSQMKLTCKPSVAYPLFIYYFFKSSIGQQALLINTSQTGVPAISRPVTSLKTISILLPPLPEQRRIAHILGTLDDKIENNRKTAKTLEAMAQAIFKSWFVDFDPVRAKMAGESRESICKRLKITPEILDLFPDRLVDSELGEIPEGWEVKPIIEEFDVTMGQSPPGNTYNQIGDGLPFYQGCADFGIKYPANRVFCTEPTRTARKGYALISVRAPVGRMNVATETCAIGRGVAAIQHHTKSTAYTYNMITSLHDVFDGFNSEGTVFGAIGKSDFHKIKIISPLDIFVTKYDSICNGIDQLQTIFHEETTRLRKIRDALLPKLISGEIRAPDVDSIVGGSHNDLFSR